MNASNGSSKRKVDNIDAEMARFEAELASISSSKSSSSSNSSSGNRPSMTTVPETSIPSVSMPGTRPTFAMNNPRGTSPSSTLSSAPLLNGMSATGVRAVRPSGPSPVGARPVWMPAPRSVVRKSTSTSSRTMSTAVTSNVSRAAGVAAMAPPTRLEPASSVTASSTLPAPMKPPIAQAWPSQQGKNSWGADEPPKKKFKDDTSKRYAAGKMWVDESLDEWDPNDFRIFVGDLANDVGSDQLYRAFQKYQSITKAKIIMDKKTGKSRGFGFVSFKEGKDYLKSLKEMNGKYLGQRPMKIRKSEWRERMAAPAIMKEKQFKKQHGLT